MVDKKLLVTFLDGIGFKRLWTSNFCYWGCLLSAYPQWRELGQNPSSPADTPGEDDKERKKEKTPNKGTTKVQTKDNTQKLKMYNGEEP